MVFGSSSVIKMKSLNTCVKMLVQNYDIPDDFFHCVMKREEIGRTSDSSDRRDGEPAQLIFLLSMKESGENTISTFIGYDTAIPHAKTDAVKTPFVAYAKLSHAMD